MDVFKTAEDFLNAQRIEFASSEVEYHPCGTDVFSVVKASRGKSLFTANDINGHVIRTRLLDFIIPASELPFRPQSGDVIISNGKSFEVFAPNDEPCWRYTGNNFDTYRIHTQEFVNV